MKTETTKYIVHYATLWNGLTKHTKTFKILENAVECLDHYRIVALRVLEHDEEVCKDGSIPRDKWDYLLNKSTFFYIEKRVVTSERISL